MRRVLVLLVVAGGLAVLFATALQQSQTRATVKTTGFLILTTNRSACSVPTREILGGPVGPLAVYCHTYPEGVRFDRKYAGSGAVVRGTRVVFP
jgi:hypothetical protein